MRPEISQLVKFVCKSCTFGFKSKDMYLNWHFASNPFEFWLMSDDCQPRKLDRKKCILRKGTYYNQATEWHNMAGGCLPPHHSIDRNQHRLNGQLFPPRFPLESSPQQSAGSTTLPAGTPHSCLVQDPDRNFGHGQNIFLWLLSLWIVDNVWSHFCSIASAQWD